ncbi:MAG: hypothetical protein LBK96_05190 [Prevotellaceae bacterium]|nr:hypothetical protein [Prevotellaceae bacterium]
MKKEYELQKHVNLTGMLCLLCLFFSCSHRDEKPPLKTRTVIVYMVGDNTLNSYVEEDINEMERGWKNSFDGDLIVYVDQTRVSPYVLKISSDRSTDIVSKEVMKYSEQNSSSIEVMEKVISDIKSMYPAKSYGLVLWSHANGWFPASTSRISKSFGDDGGASMNIPDLAGLTGKYDFFLFDACDMMGVEPVYELRNNADYIIGSVTEILAGGFPYNDILEFLFEENADLASACRKFMELYRSYSRPDMQTAALSVVKTEDMDNIASVSRSLIQKYRDNIGNIDVSQIQKYDSNDVTLIFDFLDFMENIAGDDPELQTLRRHLQSAVVFEDHTPWILSEFEIKRSCGLSCYIPGQNMNLDYAYRNTSWYKTVYNN